MAETTKPSTGTVKWFSPRKGFGFIADDDGGDDLFVHQTSIRSDGFRTLSEGQLVEFILDFAGDGRAKAVDVVAVSRSHLPLSGRGGRGAWRGGGYGGRGRGFDNYGRGSRGGRFGGGGGGGGRCYNCGRTGHMARDCYHGGDGGGVGGNRRYDGGGGGSRRYSGGGDGGGGQRGCYNCGEDGHFARDCPNNEQE